MADLVEEVGPALVPFHQGDVIQVDVISSTRSKIVVNVMGLALGFIPAREFSVDPSEINTGDTIPGYVLATENDHGWVVLSMRRADRERVWSALAEKLKNSEEVEVKVTDANRGGLVVEYKGAEGFVPSSQLGTARFPRGREEGRLGQNYRDLIGKTLAAKPITVDPKQNKLIFSEKALEQTKVEELTKQFSIGQRVKGKITGVVDFGLFVDVGGVEGLVHISEISWDRVENLRSQFKVGQETEVEVISVEGTKVSLSMKRLTPDPWLEAVAQFEIGAMVEGEVIRTTPFGAFVRLSDNAQGLVHISELGEHVKTPEDVVKVGERYQLRILSIDPLQHKISLSYRSADSEPAIVDVPAKSRKAKATKTKKTKEEE